MRRLILINTQEWLRLKFFQIVFFLAIVYFCLSYLLGSLSFAEQQRLLFDFGLAGIELATMFVAAFISTHALYREIDRKTILVILSRPIPRWHLLIGYWGSLVLLNLLMVFVLGLSLYFFLDKESYQISFVVSLLTILLKSMVIAAFGLMCSTLVRPMFALVLTISYWIMAYSILDVMFFAKKLENPALIKGADFLNFVIPNFYAFNWKNYHFLKAGLSWSEVAWAWTHCLGWCFGLLFLASLAFRRKEIV